MGEDRMNLNAAIHRRKLLLKRMQKAATRAGEYAMKPSNIVSEFGTKEEQRKAVEATWQQAEDLAKEYLDLSRKIAKANATQTVRTSKGDYTLADLVVIKQTLSALVVKPLKVCHEQAMASRRGSFGRAGAGESITIEPMFDEKDRNKREEEWDTFLSEINAKLDLANTNTYVD